MPAFIYRTYAYRLVVAISVMSLTSCYDVVDEDISAQTIILRSPSNGTSTTLTSIQFSWDEVKEIDGYTLQIHKTESGISSLIEDTNLTQNYHTYVFTPGKYTWGVSAYIGSSRTAYTTYSLQIDSTKDMTSQTVVLTAPQDNYATSENTLNIHWEKIYGATDYRLEVWSPDFQTGSKITTQDDVLDIYYSLDISGYNENEYELGIRAENGTSSQSDYTKVTFIVDRTAPNKSTQQSPANVSSQTSQEISFKWNKASDNGSPIWDRFYLYTDTTLNPIKDTLIEGNSYTIQNLSSDTYFWKIDAVDEAENQGATSGFWKVIIN